MLITVLSSFHVQSTMMPATVNVNRLTSHRPNLEEGGSVYYLTGFEVTRCNQNYRLSDSSLLIRFSDSTSFMKVTEPAEPIPLESFRFRNHSEMLGLANSNNQLPGNAPFTISYTSVIGYLIVSFTDLIGEITGVKSTVSDPPQDKNRVMPTIKMEKYVLLSFLIFTIFY